MGVLSNVGKYTKKWENGLKGVFSGVEVTHGFDRNFGNMHRRCRLEIAQKFAKREKSATVELSSSPPSHEKNAFSPLSQRFSLFTSFSLSLSYRTSSLLSLSRGSQEGGQRERGVNQEEQAPGVGGPLGIALLPPHSLHQQSKK